MLIRFKDGSGTVSLRYISEEPDRHGNIRLYFRKRGTARVRLKTAPGTDEFMVEYRAALTGSAAPKQSPTTKAMPGTLRWLATEYRGSAEFGRLDGATQTMRRRQLDRIMPKWGSGKILELTPKFVKKMRDELGKTPHAANNLLKTLSVMFRWAVDQEHMNTNPAREIKKIPTAGDGHHAWTTDEIAAYLERHPYSMKAGLALALLLFFGVRRSDVVKLGRQMEAQDGQSLRLVETKGARRHAKAHDLPILPVLRAAIDQHPGNMTYLLTSRGKPFTANGFGNWFKDQCRSANLPHCSAHGLRKAGATIAAEAGATDHQLMALYGWESPAQAAHYTKRANRKKMAGDAARLIDEDQKTNIGVAPKIRGVSHRVRTD